MLKDVKPDGIGSDPGKCKGLRYQDSAGPPRHPYPAQTKVITMVARVILSIDFIQHDRIKHLKILIFKQLRQTVEELSCKGSLQKDRLDGDLSTTRRTDMKLVGLVDNIRA